MRTALRGTWFVTAQAWRAAPASLATGWVLQFALALVPGVQVLILAALIERLDGTAQLGDVLGLVLLVVGILGLVGPLRGVADLMRSQAEVAVRDAPVWVLDEPTSSVDAESEERILARLAAGGADRITVLVSHRAWTLRGVDRIYVLDEGRLVEQGGFAELLARPGSRFAELFRNQLAQ